MVPSASRFRQCRTSLNMIRDWVAVEWFALAAAAAAFWFPQRLLLLTGIALVIVPVCWLVRRLRTGRLLVRGPVRLALLALLLATVLASLPVFDPGLALPKLLGIPLGVATLVLTANTVTSRRGMGRAMVLLAGASIVVAAVGLLATDWVGGKLPSGHQMFRIDSAASRLVPNASSGAGINPNELAGVLTLLLPVLVLRTLAMRRRFFAVWTIAPTALAAAMCAFLLLASQSRGGLAGIGAATLAGLGWWLRDQPRSPTRRRLLAGYLLLVLVCIAGGLQVTAAWVDAPAAAVSQEIDSYSARAEIWRKALSMISDFPITGIGIGQFNPVLHLLYPSSVLPPSTYVPHAHNLYLDYAAELGLPGALAFAAVVASSLYECGRASKSSHLCFRWTARGLLLGLLAFMFYGLVDAIAPGARGGIVLWVILGLCLAAGNIALEESACPIERVLPPG